MDKKSAAPAQSEEPVATLHDDGYWTWKKGKEVLESRYAGWRMDVYAAPQPFQPAQAGESNEISSKSIDAECARVVDEEFFNLVDGGSAMTLDDEPGEVNALEACRAIVKWCDENQPAGDALWCVQLARRAVAAQPAPAAKAGEPTYVSSQATNCAKCSEHKHTPLRIDWMGGYVCLTCIDKELEARDPAVVLDDERAALGKLDWLDQSTADPIEKARRVLDALVDGSPAYFYNDGFPRRTLVNEQVANVLVVLNSLARSPSPQAATCATCNGHGMIGGPSYRDPGEGGVPCPDCATTTQPAQTQALIQEAVRSLSIRADELKASNTSLDGTWCDAVEEAAYNAEVDLIKRLRALLGAAQPGKTERPLTLTPLYKKLMRGDVDICEAYLRLKVVGSCPTEDEFSAAMAALLTSGGING